MDEAFNTKPSVTSRSDVQPTAENKKPLRARPRASYDRGLIDEWKESEAAGRTGVTEGFDRVLKFKDPAKQKAYEAEKAKTRPFVRAYLVGNAEAHWGKSLDTALPASMLPPGGAEEFPLRLLKQLEKLARITSLISALVYLRDAIEKRKAGRAHLFWPSDVLQTSDVAEAHAEAFKTIAPKDDLVFEDPPVNRKRPQSESWDAEDEYPDPKRMNTFDDDEEEEEEEEEDGDESDRDNKDGAEQSESEDKEADDEEEKKAEEKKEKKEKEAAKMKGKNRVEREPVEREPVEREEREPVPAPKRGKKPA
ncbi:hypothetical protein B0A49_03497 [Cryomyces minteri]|uniref:Uncharacterized protein n=1 Tax=Cryomyces minteri TaxID=331657 RepID=A0A4U0XR40_9PEZI|nr:hypothetical protein B0A49_03497 [Cryomyces minteri]